MSAIGDYIHLHAANYLEHGVSEDGSFESWADQKKAIVDNLPDNKNVLNALEKIDLESVLTAIMQQNSNNPYIDAARKAVESRMEVLFNNSVGDIKWETGDVEFNFDANLKMSTAKSSLNVDEMLTKMTTLDNILTESAKNGTIGISDAKIQLAKLRQEYQNIIAILKSEKQRQGLPNKLTSFDAGKKFGDNSLGSLKEQLNILIKDFAAYPAVSLQKGTFFEELIRWAPIVAKQQGAVELGRVIGDVTENVVINKSNFADKYITKTLSQQVFETTKTSQGKIDVIINWENTPLKISAKNINAQHRLIQIMSNSSLLYLLQDVEPNFVNHFLNIYSTHPDGGLLSNLRKPNGIIEEVRYILLYKALTGDVANRQVANVFIVNDNTTGRVKVIDMQTIIKGLTNNVSKSAVTGVSNSMTRFKNKFASSPADRISAVLADVHSRKISAAIPTKMIFDKI